MSEVSKPKIPMAFDFPIHLTRGSGLAQQWSFPDHATKGVWYVALYFSDKTPYVLKYDGNFWRTADDKVAAVPMHVIQIPVPPPTRKADKDSE